MAKYTIELRNMIPLFGREAVEDWFKDYNLEDYLTPEEIQVIEDRGTWSKNRLASKIIDHYFMREIGFETPALFRHYVKITMKEIMEEYAPLIYSASISYDPLVNVDFTETYHHQDNGTVQNTGNISTTNNGSADSTSRSNGSGLTVNSDTPQGQVNKSSILGGSYASSTSANETESSITDHSSSSTSENVQRNDGSTSTDVRDYTKKIKGNSGVSATAQKMVEQYRDNIRALDSEIIERLNTLFMGLY